MTEMGRQADDKNELQFSSQWDNQKWSIFELKIFIFPFYYDLWNTENLFWMLFFLPKNKLSITVITSNNMALKPSLTYFTLHFYTARLIEWNLELITKTIRVQKVIILE